MSSTHDFTACALAVALALGPRGALADGASGQQAAASVLFDEAQKLMKAGDLAAACPKYAESQRMDPQLGTLLHLAECYSRSGKTASAWASFKDAAELAAQRSDPRRATAEAKVEQLGPQVSGLIIQVADDAPKATEIRQNGAVVGRAAWGSRIPTDPGVYTVSVRAPGYKPWSASVQVNGGGASVRLVVPPLEAEAPRAPASNEPAPTGFGPPESSERPAGSTQRIVGYSIAGAGVVGLVAGAVFGLKKNSEVSDRDGVCPGYTNCTLEQGARIERLTSDARSAGNLATVFFIGGGAALVGGLALVFTAPSKPRPGAALQVGPWVTSNGFGTTLGGSW